MLFTNYDVEQLLEMREDDLREVLAETPINTQELRETIYRLRRRALDYKRQAEDYREDNERLEERMTRIKSQISEL